MGEESFLGASDDEETVPVREQSESENENDGAEMEEISDKHIEGQASAEWYLKKFHFLLVL